MKTAKQQIITTLVFVSAILVLTAYKAETRKATLAVTVTGAWGYGAPDNRNILIFSGNVFSVAQYNLPAKKMISSYGGTWRANGNKLVCKTEWNSSDSLQVGNESTREFTLTNSLLTISGSGETWTRLDDGGPGELAGVWVITGNYTNDKVTKRANPFFPRRTMKVLSGKYFHWIAYNVVTKQFLNAGGGSYTTANGKYTENIAFFTKTPESVGRSLVFDYSFVDGDWRHRGQKSTGGAMDECWTKRETLEK